MISRPFDTHKICRIAAYFHTSGRAPGDDKACPTTGQPWQTRQKRGGAPHGSEWCNAGPLVQPDATVRHATEALRNRVQGRRLVSATECRQRGSGSSTPPGGCFRKGSRSRASFCRFGFLWQNIRLKKLPGFTCWHALGARVTGMEFGRSNQLYSIWCAS